uniref:Uncharacterized protein n=1 Tax=Arundo donax TaxID=35708 RepID=A0A0A9HHJ9_ARUDO
MRFSPQDTRARREDCYTPSFTLFENFPHAQTIINSEILWNDAMLYFSCVRFFLGFLNIFCIINLGVKLSFSLALVQLSKSHILSIHQEKIIVAMCLAQNHTISVSCRQFSHRK